MKYLNFTKRKFINLAVTILVLSIIFVGYKYINGFSKQNTNFNNYTKIIKYQNDTSILASIYDQKLDNEFKTSKYMIELSKSRLDQLFKILKQKEGEYENIFTNLDILMFKDFMNKNKRGSKIYNRFINEISSYFDMAFDEIVVKEKFVDDLKYLSNYYSFVKPRNSVQPEKMSVSYSFLYKHCHEEIYFFPE
jgi:hypothetical protein